MFFFQKKKDQSLQLVSVILYVDPSMSIGIIELLMCHCLTLITISWSLMVVAASNFPGSMMLTPTPQGRISSLRLSDTDSKADFDM